MEAMTDALSHIPSLTTVLTHGSVWRALKPPSCSSANCLISYEIFASIFVFGSERASEDPCQNPEGHCVILNSI